MKLEEGKFYKTRDGSKARIYFTDAGGSWPIHGALQGSGGSWYSNAWSESGYYCGSGRTHDCDIVEEWKDPPKKSEVTLYVRLWSDGEVMTSAVPPLEDFYYDDRRDVYILGCRKITVEIAEGERPE